MRLHDKGQALYCRMRSQSNSLSQWLLSYIMWAWSFFFSFLRSLTKHVIFSMHHIWLTAIYKVRMIHSPLRTLVSQTTSLFTSSVDPKLRPEAATCTSYSLWSRTCQAAAHLWVWLSPCVPPWVWMLTVRAASPRPVGGFVSALKVSCILYDVCCIILCISQFDFLNFS